MTLSFQVSLKIYVFHQTPHLFIVVIFPLWPAKPSRYYKNEVNSQQDKHNRRVN